VTDDPISSLAEAMAEVRRLRARVAELEAAGAIQRGTLQMQTQQRDDGGARFTWNVPPSAPPHNE
jgi:hypothetical protein